MLYAAKRAKKVNQFAAFSVRCVLVKQNCNTSVTFLSDLRRRKPIVCCVRSLIVVPTICISGYFRI